MAQQVKNHSPIQFLINLVTPQKNLCLDSLEHLLPLTVGKGYGNLAANNGPTSEKPFTNTISNQSCNSSKESVFRQFRTSPASHSWEALNNPMWPEKPIQAG